MKDSRKKILQSAVAVFSRNGYHQSQVEEIARRAGVGKGTVYIHFSNKAMLFAAAVSEGLETIVETVRAELESDLPFPEHLKKLVDCNVALYLQNGDLSRIMFNELSSGIEPRAMKEIQFVREKRVAFMADILMEGHRRGYIKDMDFRLAAVALIGQMDALCNHYFNNRQSMTEEDIARIMYTMIADGLLTKRN